MSILARTDDFFEADGADVWYVAGFKEKMLAGIVAFELRVTDLQCKLKLNQHRKESHAAMRVAYRAGSPDEQALGRWMDDLGMAPGQAASAA